MTMNVLVTQGGGDFTLALQNGFLQVQTLPYAGSGGTVNIIGPDVTGTGPAAAVPGNLSVVVTTLAGGGTAALARARFNEVLIEGPDATVELPAAPLTGDMVFVSFQFSGDVGAPATTINNQGSGIPVEIPTNPATYAASVSVIDSTAKLLYVFDGTGESQWSLIASNVALTTFLGGLSQSPNGATTQALVVIDPANVSTNASDSNPGSAGAPLLSFREYIRRVGSKTPTLNQATNIEYLSYPPSVLAATLDPIDIQAIGTANLTITGPGATQTPVFTGALAGVTPVNQAAGTAFTITAYAGAATGQLIVNSTRANSVSMVVSVTEGIATITQPTAPGTTGAAPLPNNAWANGDTVNAYPSSAAVVINRVSYRTSGVTGPFNGLALERLNYTGIVPMAGGTSLFLIESYGTGLQIDADCPTVNVYNGVHQLHGGPVQPTPQTATLFEGVLCVACALPVARLKSAVLTQNTYLTGPASFNYFSVGTGGVGLPNSGTTCNAEVGCSIPVGATFWGSAAAQLNMEYSARGSYAGTATATFLGIGLSLNGVALGLSRTTTAGTYTWFGNIALNVANLDAAAGAAGFGGLAFSTDGSACFAQSANL